MFPSGYVNYTLCADIGNEISGTSYYDFFWICDKIIHVKKGIRYNEHEIPDTLVCSGISHSVY